MRASPYGLSRGRPHAGPFHLQRTNIADNGGFETNTTHWGAGTGTTLTSSSEAAKYGSKSLKVLTNGSGMHQTFGNNLAVLSGATAGRMFSYSFAIRGAENMAGKVVTCALRTAGGATGQDLLGFVNVTLTAEFVRYKVTAAVIQNDRTQIRPDFHRSGQPDIEADDVYYVDGVQIEEAAFPSPYIETNGAAKTRVATRHGGA